MMERNARRLPPSLVSRAAAATVDTSKSKETGKEPIDDGVLKPMVSRMKRKKQSVNESDFEEDADRQFKAKDRREKIGGGVPRRRRAKLSAARSPGEDEKVEEDGELTVEDLISVAEEYVNANEDAKIELSSENNGKPESVKSSLDNLESSSQVYELPNRTESSSLPFEKPENGVSLPSISGNSGDHSKDMLNLLLGPLFQNL